MGRLQHFYDSIAPDIDILPGVCYFDYEKRTFAPFAFWTRTGLRRPSGSRCCRTLRQERLIFA